MTDNSQETNQRTMRAVIVCLLVAFVYTKFFNPPKTPSPATTQQPQVAGSPAAGPSPISVVAQPAQPVTVVGSPAGKANQHPTAEALQAAGVTFVDSEVARVAISHLGARPQAFALNSYKVRQGDDAPLDLLGDLHDAPMPLGVYIGNESDELVNYSLVRVNGSPVSGPANLKVAPGGSVNLEFKGALPSGNQITKKVSFTAGSYLFTVDVELASPAPSGQLVWVEWAHRYPAESSRTSSLPHVTYFDGFNKIHHLATEEFSEALRDFGTARWVALTDLYFMAALIPTTSGRNTLLARSGDLYISRVAGTTTGGSFSFYVGPKEYNLLKSVGDFQLERSIDLGFFSFLALPLLWLLHYLYQVVHNYGLAIIALTLIIKTALLPLSQASFKSMKAMQEIQPEMKALRERVKDPTQLNQEIMALYKRRGVNPMGGCLPILIQIPVFFGLYQALLNAIELRHSPFALWITDLSSPESLQLFGIGVPVMVLLMAASMLIQQWTTPNPSADPAQQKMMMIMPVVFAGMFIIFPMPAGLVLYWLVNNLISITQQMYLRNSQAGSVYWGTFVASVAIFGVGFLLTLI